MKAIRLIILIILISIHFSCQKENLPESAIENAPIFSFIGNVNNNPIAIKAGIDDYYMFSSYIQDTNNVYNFIGNIKQSNCVGCPNSISIQVNDFAVSAFEGSSFIDSALFIGFYDYVSGVTDSISYEVNFQSEFNLTASYYLWDFGDGTTSNLPNPSHVYETKGEYNVCLTIGSNDIIPCTSSICNIQKIGLPGNACRTNISYTSYSLGSFNFFQSTTGIGPFNYTWNFGDGTGSDLENPSHVYFGQNNYMVSLFAVDANSDTAFANSNIIVSQDSTICATNYSIGSITPIDNLLSLSNIIITWTGEDGIVYTSNNFQQPEESNFQILSIDDYQNNENNQKTKKIHIAFNCTVYSGSNAIEIENGEAIIAVAYK
jgi:PKD repeat protein